MIRMLDTEGVPPTGLKTCPMIERLIGQAGLGTFHGRLLQNDPIKFVVIDVEEVPCEVE